MGLNLTEASTLGLKGVLVVVREWGNLLTALHQKIGIKEEGDGEATPLPIPLMSLFSRVQGLVDLTVLKPLSLHPGALETLTGPISHPMGFLVSNKTYEMVLQLIKVPPLLLTQHTLILGKELWLLPRQIPSLGLP